MRRAVSVAIIVGTLVLGFAASPAWAAGEETHDGWFASISRLVNFALLAGLLVFALRRPLADYLDARTQHIRQQLAEAEEKRARAVSERERAEAQLAHLNEEIAEVRHRGQAEAEAERQRILKTAEEEATRIAETARKEISVELQIARRKLLEKATELSVKLAEKKIAEQLTDDDRRDLVDRSIEKLKEVH